MDDRPATWASTPDSYTRTVLIRAPIQTIFAMLATLEGIRTWWEGSVTGTASEHGDLRFSFPDSDDYTQVRVDRVTYPSDVAWLVIEDSGFGGEWMGTSILFHLDEDVDGSCMLTLHHDGLTPALDCFIDCRSGWDRHLEGIQKGAEMTSDD